MESPSAAAPLNVAVIGAGFAKTAILPALAQLPGAKAVAVASSRLSSAGEAADLFGVPAAYDDWRKMLAEQPLDLVCIATPTHLHAPMALAALEAGAHVLCEKPMALDRQEAAAMLQRASSLGRLHMVDHELRFNPNRRKVKALIEGGAIGDVRHVQIYNVTTTYGDPGARRESDWLSYEALGGGRLGANGSHQIDLLRWWLGEVCAVSAQLATLTVERRDPDSGKAWQATADDLSHLSLAFEGGALAHVLISGVARHELGNHTQVFGSEGTILLSDDDEILRLARAGEGFEDVSEADPHARLPGILPRVWNVSVVGLLEELISAIREGRPVSEGATFADGLRCQEVMDAARLSSAQRRWIDIAELRVDGAVDAVAEQGAGPVVAGARVPEARST